MIGNAGSLVKLGRSDHYDLELSGSIDVDHVIAAAGREGGSLIVVGILVTSSLAGTLLRFAGSFLINFFVKFFVALVGVSKALEFIH